MTNFPKSSEISYQSLNPPLPDIFDCGSIGVKKKHWHWGWEFGEKHLEETNRQGICEEISFGNFGAFNGQWDGHQ
jgi:hypothetical protein